MQSLRFYLRLSPQEILGYYQGQKQMVRVTTRTGQSLQFKVSHLRQFVTKNGIHGEFEIFFDDQNQFVKLVQLIVY